ncbi:MAG TPA: hypothetical protein VGF16_09980 [Bryobacteraceae bacterium]|jgi:hypothetical protein
MIGDPHETAKRLIAQDRVEGVSAQEREWLDRHLSECKDCERLAAGTDRAIALLRTVSISVPADLAERARLRVDLRTQEVDERRRWWWLPWTACTVSWAIGIVSAPYVWRAFSWLGHEAGVPTLVWKAGFALWWAAPALFAAGALLWERWDLPWYRTR